MHKFLDFVPQFSLRKTKSVPPATFVMQGRSPDSSKPGKKLFLSLTAVPERGKMCPEKYRKERRYEMEG
jgi:hypothetical protein